MDIIYSLPTNQLILFISIFIAGFYMAWSIGANDVANAMGTSVGSRAITLKQAVLIAALLEFTGAFFFGRQVSETIQKGIIDTSLFSETPLLLVYGMLASLLAAGAWLQLATYFGWPVSTTHSIIGAIVGVGLVLGDYTAIQWENVFFIVSSWIFSPILGGIIAYALFRLIIIKVFFREQPVEYAKKIAPIAVFFIFFILAQVMIFNGLKNANIEVPRGIVLLSSTTIGAIAALIGRFLVQKVRPVKYKTGDDIHRQDFATVERIFGYLQILSASMMAFAHGANDVANAIGPVAGAVNILLTGKISETSQVPNWTLALGGIGIVIGLATWGWRVIETIGKKITELTPTRGFAAEFSTALTILFATGLGLPISTTHTLVGAVVGVGLARGIESLSLYTVGSILISWLITVPAGAGLAILFLTLIRWFFTGAF